MLPGIGAAVGRRSTGVRNEIAKCIQRSGIELRDKIGWGDRGDVLSTGHGCRRLGHRETSR